MSETERTVTVSFRLPVDDVARLEAMAKRECNCRAGVTERLVKQALRTEHAA